MTLSNKNYIMMIIGAGILFSDNKSINKKRDIHEKENNIIETKLDAAKEIMYKLDDYEYYNYNFRFIDFDTNKYKLFFKDNSFIYINVTNNNLEFITKYFSFTKTITLEIDNIIVDNSNRIYYFNQIYKSNFLERIWLGKELELKGKISIKEDLIILELDKNHNKDCFRLIKKYDPNLFDYFEIKNYNLKFYKN